MQAPIARAALALAICLTSSAAAQQPPLGYAIDVTDRADDQFKVTAWVSGLTAENAVYQFAATAPGTYQVMDIGRFVRGFESFDAAGRPVPVEQVSVNQWKLGDAPRVRTLRYTIAETWDTPVDAHPVYLMCGTSIEKDHVLINPHAVIGYPTGMQARPIRLRIRYPASWKAEVMWIASSASSPPPRAVSQADITASRAAGSSRREIARTVSGRVAWSYTRRRPFDGSAGSLTPWQAKCTQG